MGGQHIEIDRLQVKLRGAAPVSAAGVGRICRSSFEALDEMLETEGLPLTADGETRNMSPGPLRVSLATMSEEAIARAMASAVYRSLRGGA